MIAMILLFFQVTSPTPMPVAQNITPYPTPTPAPLESTAQALEEEYQGYQATVQALTDDQSLTTDGQQIYRNGSAVLPDFTSPAMVTTIGYIKFALDANNTKAVFGPFAIIVNHLRFFGILVLGWFTFYFGQAAITTLSKFVLFIIEHIVEILIFVAILLVMWLIYAVVTGIVDVWSILQSIWDYLVNSLNAMLEWMRSTLNNIWQFVRFW